MGVPAYLQPDLEADLVLPPTPAGRVNNQWMVQVEPKFHDDASNLEQLVPFEECIELHSSGKEFVKAPEYLLLTHNGRSFNMVVEPTNLSDGLHYYELCGIDCKAPWRGPVFRIPVTITKAMAVKNRPALPSFSGMSFLPEKLHLSHQQYKLLNQAHKTWFASKSSHNIHKTSLKDNSKNTRSDRNVVKGARAARIQRNKMIREQKRGAVLKEKRASS